MSGPSAQELYATVEATWPPAATKRVGPWTIRDGAGGGKRASAATLEGSMADGDIDTAEAEMVALGQTPLFMIREGEEAFDAALEARGYEVIDPVLLYSCPIETLAETVPPRVSTFVIWEPLSIMNELWAEGGIGAERRAVMARVKGPKTAVLARQKDRAAGCAFAAIDGDVAMIHAIYVEPALRRLGAGINMMRAASIWAQDNGAGTFALAVTYANEAANALYSSLGMERVGRYHYRILQGPTKK